MKLKDLINLYVFEQFGENLEQSAFGVTHMVVYYSENIETCIEFALSNESNAKDVLTESLLNSEVENIFALSNKLYVIVSPIIYSSEVC